MTNPDMTRVVPSCVFALVRPQSQAWSVTDRFFGGLQRWWGSQGHGETDDQPLDFRKNQRVGE